ETLRRPGPADSSFLLGQHPGGLDGAAHDLLEAELGLPAQQRLDAGDVGDQGRWVSGPTLAHFGHDVTAGHLGAGIDDLLDRGAGSGADVEYGLPGPAGLHVVESGDVCLDEVLDVDVVADAGTIGDVVVVAKDGRSLAVGQPAEPAR